MVNGVRGDGMGPCLMYIWWGTAVVRTCKKLIRERHPSLAFLMESKLKKNEAEKLNFRLG